MEETKRPRLKSNSSQEWIKRELAIAQLPDARLKNRLQKVGKQLSKGVGRGIPWVCQDWAATKAAYRLFSNTYFNLPKQIHDLLRTILLRSAHSLLFAYQFVSVPLVQNIEQTTTF
jgi:hypothetical protein